MVVDFQGKLKSQHLEKRRPWPTDCWEIVQSWCLKQDRPPWSSHSHQSARLNVGTSTSKEVKRPPWRWLLRAKWRQNRPVWETLIAVGWLLFSHKAVEGSDGKISYTPEFGQKVTIMRCLGLEFRMIHVLLRESEMTFLRSHPPPKHLHQL